ncbi:BA14K family protein [Rhizobium cauense]|uniref:BA14K family protein n=1 Tax=Rhizobium cauense TaxID=1166683 RepID=UPI001C6F0859|nr:BA14K family protein [Rhizobium cauense]MBW9117672.1 BA14K family protein [Rhizobium cauense]
MKTLASLAFGVASSIGLCIAVTSVAQEVIAETGTEKLVNVSSPDLWTSKPVRVDTAVQNYERIPAAYSTYASDAPTARIAADTPRTGSTSLPVPEKPLLSAEHLSFCASRYRSYDPASNTYRAYSGSTKTCASPYANEKSGDGEEQTAKAGAEVLDATAAAWCAARYQSYRASDNTYQPYDGPRRTCIAPTRQEIASAR